MSAEAFPGTPPGNPSPPPAETTADRNLPGPLALDPVGIGMADPAPLVPPDRPDRPAPEVGTGYELFLVSFTGNSKCRVTEDRTAAEHLADSAHTSWLHIVARDAPATERLLTEDLGFHPVAAEDALTDDERPELKEFGDYVFFVIPAVVRTENPVDFRIAEVAFFLRGHAFVTVVRETVPSLRRWHDRLVGRDTVKDPRAGFLMHAVLDTLIDDYFPVMDDIEEAVDRISDALYSEDEGDDEAGGIKEMIRLKQRNLRLRRSLAPVREVLNGLQRRDLDVIPDDLRPYVQDVYTNSMRIIESLDMSRDSLSNLFDVRLSVTNNRLNVVVERMTAISTCLMLATLVAGIYGMNFKNMPELDWRYGYPLSLALMLLLAGGALLIFKRKRWI